MEKKTNIEFRKFQLFNNSSEKAKMEALNPSLEYDKEYLGSIKMYKAIRSKEMEEILKKYGDDEK